MTIQEIKELLELFHSSGVAEMEVQRGENRVRLKRAPSDTERVVPAALAPAPAAAHVAGGPTLAPAQAPPAESNDTLVCSPIVGTFYDASAPDAAPFVKVGDAVERGVGAQEDFAL